MEQRTPEWYDARLGRFTASEIHKLMGTKGLGQTGESYIFEKVAESITGMNYDHVQTWQMERGTLLEPDARDLYQKVMKYDVKEVGFVKHPLHPKHAGCSPDGIIESLKKGVEIKCPMQGTHARYMTLRSADELKKIKPEYYWQIQYSMLITGAGTWDFVSYNPDFMKYSLFIMEIKRNEYDIELLQSRLSEAIELKEKFLNLIIN